MLVLGYLTQGRQSLYGKTVPGWVEKLRCMLHERWNETISLEGLSAVTGVHPRTISHYFPKYFSCTLGEYMRKLKVDKALSLIKPGKRSLMQVAYECGFFDQSHFIRAFRSCTGMALGEYRKW